MYKKNPNSRGFTLIELLVTTALTLVLAGGALAAYNTFNTRQSHIQVARNVISQLERAKARASAGEKPASCTTLDGFRVWAVANAATYAVSIRCNGQSTENELRQYALPSGYTFQTGFSVVFPPLPRNAAASDQIVTVLRTGSTQAYRFTIRLNGTILDQGMVSL